MVEFEVLHTAEGLRRVYTQWWERRHRGAYRIAFGVMVIAFAAMLLLRNASWPLVVVATLASAQCGFLTVLRDTAIRLALENLRLLGPGPFRYRLTDTALSESSAVGYCELRWRVFDSVLRLNDALILLRKPSEAQSFIVFPLSQIPPDLENRLDAHLRSGTSAPG